MSASMRFYAELWQIKFSLPPAHNFMCKILIPVKQILVWYVKHRKLLNTQYAGLSSKFVT